MAEVIQDFPKWVKVKGDGNPLQPGYELANSAEEEAELLKGVKAKADDK